MANLRVLKDTEKKLVNLYNGVRSSHSSDTIGTAVHGFIQYIVNNPILKDIVRSLVIQEEGPSLVELQNQSRGRRLEPPVERNKKARLCYEMLSDLYRQQAEEKGNFTDGLENWSYNFFFDKNIETNLRSYVESFITPFYNYLDEELEALIRDEEVKDDDVTEPNPKNINKVFVVHGRDMETLDEVLAFLKANGLDPLTFEDARMLVDEAAPNLLDVVNKGMSESWAVLVLITPDDVGRLKEEPNDMLQERPRENVVFEGGLAFGRRRRRTVLVEYETTSIFSDLHGHYVVRLQRGEGGIEGLDDILKQLRAAGCVFEPLED